MTVDAFLEAADRILRREGYEAASTNRLARVAGFSVGSLYQYFDDKQAVVGTLIDRELRREARDLVTLLDRCNGAPLADELPPIYDFVLERRSELGHLHRTLAQHSDELASEPPLRYAIRIQTPICGDALQRCGTPHLVGMGDGRVEPRMGVLIGLAHAASHIFALESPVHVTPAAVSEVLVQATVRYLESEQAASPSALSLVTTWRDDAKTERSAGERRARRLQEVRTHLLQQPGRTSDGLEPVVHVGAAIYELVFDYAMRKGETEAEEHLLECARVLDALAVD